MRHRHFRKISALFLSFSLLLAEADPAFARGRVLHIQDIHSNAKAQRQISDFIQSALKQGSVSMVALEGAFSPIDLHPFHVHPYHDSVKTAAETLLRERRISGPIHALLRSTATSPSLVGIDDPGLYRANLEAFQTASRHSGTIRIPLNRWETALAREKARLFNGALREFDQKVEMYRCGREGLGDYARALSRHLDSLPPVTRSLLAILSAESALQGAALQEDRVKILRKLNRVLTKEENAALRAAHHGNFYRQLRDLCQKEGIRLNPYPALKSYMDLILKADGINGRDLTRELQGMETQIYRALAQTEEEKELIRESRRFRLIKKLADFSLSPVEWEDYKKLRISERERWFLTREQLEPFENFYRFAEKRNIKMADNLLRAVKKLPTPQTRPGKEIVLVTGGFHSNEVDKRLKEAGMAVVSYTPKLTGILFPSGSKQLGWVARQKNPFNALFPRKNFFLSPSPISFSVQSALLPSLIIGLDRLAGRVGDEATALFDRLSREAADFVLARVVGQDALVTIGNGIGQETLGIRPDGAYYFASRGEPFSSGPPSEGPSPGDPPSEGSPSGNPPAAIPQAPGVVPPPRTVRDEQSNWPRFKLIVDYLISNIATRSPRAEDDLRRLHAEVVGGEPIALLPLNSHGAVDWNRRLQRYWQEGWKGSIPRLLAFAYFSRRVLEATDYFGNFKDPFASLKDADFKGAWSLFADEYNHIQQIRGDERGLSANILRELIHGIFFENDFSPSFSFPRGLAYFPDKMDQVVEFLLSQPLKKQIDIVLNHSGSDLLFSLALADSLLSTDLTETVTLHLKSHPFYLDATSGDVEKAIHHLEFQPSGALHDLGRRLAKYHRYGRLKIFSNDFWASGDSLEQLPKALQDQFDRSDLVILLGNINYLRLIGDRDWPEEQFPETRAVYLKPAVVVMRRVRRSVLKHLPAPVSAHIETHELPALKRTRPKRTWGLVQAANLGYRGEHKEQLARARDMIRPLHPSPGTVRVVNQTTIRRDVPLYRSGDFVAWTPHGDIYIDQRFLENLPKNLGASSPALSSSEDDPIVRALVLAILKAGYAYNKWLRYPAPLTQDPDLLHRRLRQWHDEAAEKGFSPNSTGKKSLPLILQGFEEAFKPAERSLAHLKLREAAVALGVSESDQKTLLSPLKIFRFEIPVDMGDGTTRVFLGYRVHDNNRLGSPMGGGFRYSENLTLEQVQDLAFEMTVKNALHGLPFGGAKGGVVTNPQKLTPIQLARLTRGLIREAYRQGAIGPKIDRWAPDMGSTSQTMAWMVDEFIRQRTEAGYLWHPDLQHLTSIKNNELKTPFLDAYLKIFKVSEGILDQRDTSDWQIDGSDLAVVTGKPPGQGGVEGREAATGYGVVYVVSRVIKNLSSLIGWESLQGKRAALVGFGNVGSYAGRSLVNLHNALITSVGIWRGRVWNPSGIDMDQLAEHLRRTRHQHRGDDVSDFDQNEEGAGQQAGAAVSGVDALFEGNPHILIPAAASRQITKENVHRIVRNTNVKIIVEAANGPMSPEAEEILHRERPDIVIVPDVLANAGGVTVSYFEWALTGQKLNFQTLDTSGWLKNLVYKLAAYIGLKSTRDGVEGQVLGHMKSVLKQSANNVIERALKIKRRKGLEYVPLRQAAYEIVAHRLTGKQFPGEETPPAPPKKAPPGSSDKIVPLMAMGVFLAVPKLSGLHPMMLASVLPLAFAWGRSAPPRSRGRQQPPEHLATSMVPVDLSGKLDIFRRLTRQA